MNERGNSRKGPQGWAVRAVLHGCCIGGNELKTPLGLENVHVYHEPGPCNLTQVRDISPWCLRHIYEMVSAGVAHAGEAHPADQSPFQRLLPAGLGQAERLPPVSGVIVRSQGGWAQPHSLAMPHAGSVGSGWKQPALLPRTSGHFLASAALHINAHNHHMPVLSESGTSPGITWTL